MALWSGLIAKPQRTPLKSRPSLTLFFLLAGAFLLTLVPHVLQFPPWLTVVIVAAMATRSIVEVYRLPLPSSTFCGILAILLFGLTWLQFGTIMGRTAGTAVTAGLLAIKFYEIRQPRDISLIIFSCFFVVMSALLFSQVLELFVYCLIMMWILTALLLRVNTGDSGDDALLHMLGKSGLVFIQSLPLALLLFFFFPRINGPLGFSLTEPPIGLTDTVAPGSIAKLSQDDTPAMYVEFVRGGAPPPDSMYWRAIVMYQYLNGVFTTGDRPGDPSSSEMRTPDLRKYEERIVQMITVRPNNQHWLYALDVPIEKPQNTAENDGWASLYRGDVLRVNVGKLDHIARYYVASSPFRQEETLGDVEWAASLQYPQTEKDGAISQAVINFSNQLFEEAGRNPDTYHYAVLKYFHQGGFVYSTDLPEQSPDWLTEFLLKRKTGYCEHFAAAFAVLMRLHGIPTRLVAGYLGGDYNPYTGDYTVSQSNAHAWDEMWVPTNGWLPANGKKNPRVGHWVRVDPTAMAASSGETAQQGANNPDNESSIRIASHAPSFAESFFPSWVKGGMREVRLRREQMETSWDNVVLSYDTDAQFKLAQVLGMGGNPLGELLMVCVGAAAVCAIALWRWLARKPKISPVEFLYNAFCRNMARRGIPRSAWEGPIAFTERVAEAFPDDTPALRKVGNIVARARYSAVPADGDSIVRLESALALLSASQAASASRDKW